MTIITLNPFSAVVSFRRSIYGIIFEQLWLCERGIRLELSFRGGYALLLPYCVSCIVIRVLERENEGSREQCELKERELVEEVSESIIV